MRRRVLVGALLVLAACSSGRSVATSTTPLPTVASTFDAAAAKAKMQALMASGELTGPQGAPYTEHDQAATMQLVEEACKGPGKVQALFQSDLGRNPYLLNEVLTIVNAGCPDVVARAGITFNGRP